MAILSPRNLKVLATLAFLVSSTVGALAWELVDYRDPTNSEVVKAAAITVASGHSVTIFRSSDSKVRWVLALPPSSFERMTASSRVAALSVDGGDVTDIEQRNGGIFPVDVIVRDRFVRSILWHGEGSSPTRGTLRNLLDGKLLTVRFFQEGGGFSQADFDLTGIAPMIEQALEISALVDPDVYATETARDDAIMKAILACRGATSPSVCAGVLSDCMGDTATLTPTQLKSCMSGRGFPFN